MDSALTTVGLPVALAIIMFGLGLDLTPADFRRVGKQPKAVLVALACQLLLLPAICFGLVILFDLPALLGIGLLLLAAVVAGHLARRRAPVLATVATSINALAFGLMAGAVASGDLVTVAGGRAGIDPATFITRYADRVGGIHLKDCFADFLDHSPAARGRSYPDLQRTKRLWAEPGTGVIDLDAVVAALPAGYDGDYMIEIDEPSGESVAESHRIGFAWAERCLPAVV